MYRSYGTLFLGRIYIFNGLKSVATDMSFLRNFIVGANEIFCCNMYCFYGTLLLGYRYFQRIKTFLYNIKWLNGFLKLIVLQKFRRNDMSVATDFNPSLNSPSANKFRRNEISVATDFNPLKISMCQAVEFRRNGTY